MAVCSVTLTANAGVILELNGHSIWVDALHTEPVAGFSSVSPALWRQIQEQVPPPDLLCFTHCHPDHYSHALVSEALRLWPSAGLALPRRDFPGQLLISGQEARLSAGDKTLRFLRLPHEGTDDRSAPHYGLLISSGGFRVLIAGDCQPASPTLTQHLNGVPLDLAILNFPWLTLHRGRRCLEEVLRPRCLLLCHLPFPEDDVNGWLNAARSAAQAANLPDVRLLVRPLQRELVAGYDQPI